jgi:hypothetical protein
MRSLSSFSLAAVLALGSLALGGCGSKDSRSAKERQVGSDDDARDTSDDTASDGRTRPELPVPRRMRGEDPDQTGDDDTDRRRVEWRERSGERFAEMREKYDADGDGKLNDAERTQMQRARIKDRVARADANSDGMVSREEAEASPRGGRMYRNFDEMDTDGNKLLSPEEIELAMEERRARRMERRRQREADGAAQTSEPGESSADEQ